MSLRQTPDGRITHTPWAYMALALLFALAGGLSIASAVSPAPLFDSASWLPPTQVTPMVFALVGGALSLLLVGAVFLKGRVSLRRDGDQVLVDGTPSKALSAQGLSVYVAKARSIDPSRNQVWYELVLRRGVEVEAWLFTFLTRWGAERAGRQLAEGLGLPFGVDDKRLSHEPRPMSAEDRRGVTRAALAMVALTVGAVLLLLLMKLFGVDPRTTRFYGLPGGFFGWARAPVGAKARHPQSSSKTALPVLGFFHELRRDPLRAGPPAL